MVVAGWIILRWLHQKLWPKALESPRSGGCLKSSDEGGIGARREFDLMLAPPGRLRRQNNRAAGASTASLQNAENELRRRKEEERRWRRTMRDSDVEMDNESRQKEKELVRLQAEVESLEAVVEMRGEEVRRLRKQLEGREREEEEEVEMMWDRVSKVAMMMGEVKVRVAATQTEGASTFLGLSQSQGTETMEDDCRQQTMTKADAEEQDKIEECKNVRRSKKEVFGRRREEDRLSLESGYFTHSDEETISISSSPIPNKESESLPHKESEYLPNKESETLPSKDGQITCDKDASQIVDSTPNCDTDLEGIEDKPKKSPVHERRPSRFLI